MLTTDMDLKLHGKKFALLAVAVFAFLCVQIQIAQTVDPVDMDPLYYTQVLKPNGGEIIKPQTTYQIRWQTGSGVNFVTLSYSADGGATFVPIAQHIPNTGNYTWTLPNIETHRAIVRVATVNATSQLLIHDDSNWPFSISMTEETEVPTDPEEPVTPPEEPETPPEEPPTPVIASSIQINAPLSGANVFRSQPQMVSWESEGGVVTVNLYAQYAGTPVLLAQGLPANGSYTWTISEDAQSAADIIVRGLNETGEIVSTDISTIYIRTDEPQVEPVPPPQEPEEEPVDTEEPEVPVAPPVIPAPPVVPESPQVPPPATTPTETPESPVTSPDTSGPDTPVSSETPVVDEPITENPVAEQPVERVPSEAETPSEASRGFLGNTATTVSAVFANLGNRVTDLRANPIAQDVATVSAPTATVAVVASVAVLATSFELFPFLQYIFTSPILFIARRRRKAYGRVYNSLTKLPIPFATLRFYDQQNKLVKTVVTDQNGRYIVQLPVGTYRPVVIKPGFIFPSTILSGRTEDAQYLDVYTTGLIRVTDDTVVLQASFPMDPGDAAAIPHRAHRHERLRLLQRLIAPAGALLSLYVAFIAPNPLTIFLAGVHIVILATSIHLTKPDAPTGWGIISDAEGQPMNGAIVRLFSNEYNKLIETQRTDKKGRYAFIVGPNVYRVSATGEAEQATTVGPYDLSKKNEPQALAVNVALEARSAEQTQVPEGMQEAAQETPGQIA